MTTLNRPNEAKYWTLYNLFTQKVRELFGDLDEENARIPEVHFEEAIIIDRSPPKPIEVVEVAEEEARGSKCELLAECMRMLSSIDTLVHTTDRLRAEVEALRTIPVNSEVELGCRRIALARAEAQLSLEKSSAYAYRNEILRILSSLHI